MAMNKEMKNLAEWTIKTAKSLGADACGVSINQNRTVEISYRKQKPENIKEASTRNLGVNLYVDGRYSSQSTSDLRKDALKEFLGSAIGTTKWLAEDPFRTLPDPKYYQGRADKDLAQVDPAYPKFSPEKRHELAQAVEKACLKAGGEKTISVTAEEQDVHSQSLMMTSNGFEGFSEATVYVAGASMTAQGEGDRRPNGYHYIVTMAQDDLPSPDEIGREAAQRTLSLLGAKKLKTENLPIIIENRSVPRIFGGFMTAMFGRSIQQKQSFLADKKGKKIGSRIFSLVDDPFIKKGLGSRLFDGDGFAAKKRTMIEAGVLKDFYIDWYYSRKLDMEPTTGSPSNLVVPPGKRSVKEIMKDLGRGIFITGFIGGNSNPTTGDASIGIVGHLFDGGDIIHPVTEMNIASNHLEFWNKLVEAADDSWIYSQQRFPSLVFEDIVVAGV
jgi:PmbA protein